VCLPLISIAVVLFLPRSYETTASLWALRRYEIIGATGPESNLYATPAETQTTAFTELLHTRVVAITIARSANLAPTLSLSESVLSNPALLDDALFSEISQHVLVQAQGYNLFVVSYTNRNPVIAKQIVAAAIKSYSQKSSELVVAEGQQLVQSYQLQLEKAQRDLNEASTAETRYLRAHPNVSQDALRVNPDYAALSDPQYAELHTQSKHYQSIVDTIRANIANLQQQISQQGLNSESLFKVVDPPIAANQPVSRSKLLMTAVGAALALALLACAMYIIILMRRDRAVYSVHDLQKVISLPVVMQLPYFSSEAVLSLVSKSPLSNKDEI